MLLYIIKIVTLRVKKLEEHLRISGQLKLMNIFVWCKNNGVNTSVRLWPALKINKNCYALGKIWTRELKTNILNHCAKGRAYVKDVQH